jgi:hypothetical protein
MLPVVVGLGAAVVSAGGSGPAAPPSNVTTFLYAGSLIGVQWANGDASAETEIAYAATESGGQPDGDPLSFGTVGAGETAYETGQAATQYYWVRHVRNGQYSAWVIADG